MNVDKSSFMRKEERFSRRILIIKMYKINEFRKEIIEKRYKAKMIPISNRKEMSIRL